MPTEITAALVRKHLTASRRERVDVVDSRQRGLQLRVSGLSVTWWFRTEAGGVHRRVRLGDAATTTLADARRIAGDAMDMVRRSAGEPDDAWVAAWRISKGLDEAPAAPTRSRDRWTYGQARDAYLRAMVGVLRPKTLESYRHCLTHPALRPVEHEDVGLLTRQRLATLVAGLHAEGKQRAAVNLANALRPMWKHLENDAVVGRSHVTPGEMDRLRAPRWSRVVRQGAGRRVERTPDVESCGRLLAVARSGVLEPVLARAVEVLVLTAQRRFSVVLTRREHLAEDGTHFAWTLPPENLKTGEHRQGAQGEVLVPHELSLPSGAAGAFRRAVEAAGESEWAFPGVRPKRRGMPSTHLNESTLTHCLGELPDVAFSPHDVRRAFVTAIQEAGFERHDASVILDHAEGRGGRDTTAKHYDRHRRLGRKLAMLQAWQDMLDPVAARIAGEVDWADYRRRLMAIRKARREKKPSAKSRKAA